MYGWAWAIGFIGQGMIVAGLAPGGGVPEVVTLAANAIAALVVGLLYMAGGAAVASRPRCTCSAPGWSLVGAGASARRAARARYLVMALAGGGGMLVGAASSARCAAVR